MDFDDSWTKAPELQTLGLVMEQDTFNMESVQRGLETTRRPYVIASTYQEGIMTWRHDLLSRAGLPTVGRDVVMTAPVGAIRHPLNPNAYYVGDGDGTVRVTMGTRWGRFDQSGKYRRHLVRGRPRAVRVGLRAAPVGHHRISRVLDMPAER